MRKTKLAQPLTSNCELRPVNFVLSQRREAEDLEKEEKKGRGAGGVDGGQAEMITGWETRGDTKEGSEKDEVSYSDHSATRCPAQPAEMAKDEPHTDRWQVRLKNTY